MIQPLNGVITALATFEQPEAIPALINALGEDEVRSAAEAGLASLGAAARSPLLEAADRFKANNDLSESQLRKCRSILSLLGDVALDSADVERIRLFMTSVDVQVSLLSCRIALRNGPKIVRSDAQARLA
jgi:hypothetical protein